MEMVFQARIKWR